MQLALLLQFKNSFVSREPELPYCSVRQVDFVFSFANFTSLNTEPNPTYVGFVCGGRAGYTALHRFHSGG